MLIDDGVEEALGVAADALPLRFEFIRRQTSATDETNKQLARGRVRSGDDVIYACEEAGGAATLKVQVSLLAYALTYIGSKHAEMAAPSDREEMQQRGRALLAACMRPVTAAQ